MNIEFIKGKAVIKNGRKIIAKIIDKAVFYKERNIPSTFSQYPFSLELNGGIAECTSLDDAIGLFNKCR